jgi:UDP-glucose 4-epimerase
MNRKLRDSVILVTGGAGFIGSNLVERLLEEEAREVIIIDNLFCGREVNIRHPPHPPHPPPPTNKTTY